jgi:hypothetical protein
MKSNLQRHAIALVTLVVAISVVALVVLERGSTAACTGPFGVLAHRI